MNIQATCTDPVNGDHQMNAKKDYKTYVDGKAIYKFYGNRNSEW